MILFARSILLIGLMLLLNACVYFPHHSYSRGYGSYHYRGYDNYHGNHHRDSHRHRGDGHHGRRHHGDGHHGRRHH